MMKVNTASHIRRTVGAMIKNRVLYAGAGVAWAGIGLFWIGTALAFLDGNSNTSNAVVTGAGATLVLAVSTVGVHLLAKKRGN